LPTWSPPSPHASPHGLRRRSCCEPSEPHSLSSHLQLPVSGPCSLRVPFVGASGPEVTLKVTSVPWARGRTSPLACSDAVAPMGNWTLVPGVNTKPKALPCPALQELVVEAPGRLDGGAGECNLAP